jgi:urease accessory protein
MTQLSHPSEAQSLFRLLQLCSASFPVGAYAFSQGLEWAVEAGWVNDLPTLNQWLQDQLSIGMAGLDIPILLRVLTQLSEQGNTPVDFLDHWNDLLLANRESHELRVTELAMGEAAKRIARELALPIPPISGEASFLIMFALFACHWGISVEAASQGYLWAWLENQVTAAVKLIPLGQSQAQRALDQNLNTLSQVLTEAKKVPTANFGASLPGLAIASALHETQYTRLFRS